jgi:hypothetical protein
MYANKIRPGHTFVNKRGITYTATRVEETSQYVVVYVEGTQYPVLLDPFEMVYLNK